MKSYKAYGDSDYLKKEDFPEAEIVVIEKAREERVQAPGKRPKKKVILQFEGIEKGLVLNKRNGDTLFKITGSEYPDEWVGLRVGIRNDPTVEFGGEQTEASEKPAPPADDGEEPPF